MHLRTSLLVSVVIIALGCSAGIASGSQALLDIKPDARVVDDGSLLLRVAVNCIASSPGQLFVGAEQGSPTGAGFTFGDTSPTVDCKGRPDNVRVVIRPTLGSFVPGDVHVLATLTLCDENGCQSTTTEENILVHDG